MSSKALCLLVRLAVIAVAVCALLLLVWVVPAWERSIVEANPEFSGWYLPWLILIWAAALPCFAILVYIWRVSGAIGREEVFTVRTAQWIRTSALLLFGDVGLFFLANVVFMLLGMSHPGLLLVSLLIDIFATALALLAAVLARYITKAAALQEVSEGTI